MSTPDTTANNALQAQVIKPVWFAYLDIDGDPVRVNTSGADITPTGTGDADLDGHSFVGINGQLVRVSPVKFATGGSESVAAELSGIPGVDDDTLAQLADPANWRGRNARLWKIIRNAANVRKGGYHNYYTGKMVGLQHAGSSEEQKIKVTIESYLAVLSQASNRTYMDQSRYDAGDNSAAAAIAIANGNYTGTGANPGVTFVTGGGQSWLTGRAVQNL
jgi:hypothetical protein